MIAVIGTKAAPAESADQPLTVCSWITTKKVRAPSAP